MPLPFSSRSIFTILQPRALSEVWRRDGLTGLDCGLELTVTLPSKATMVEATLVHFAEPAKMKAINADGSDAGDVTMTGPPGQAETLEVSGKEIERVVVTAPRGQALLLKFCFALADARELDDRAALVRGGAGGGQPGAPDGREGEGESERGIVMRLSAFTPAAAFAHAGTFRASSLAAMRLSTHGDRPCVRYDVDLREQHEHVRVSIAVPAALAIAMREGKAVDTRVGSDPSGPQQFLFENRRIDRVLVYVTQLAKGLTICADILPAPEQEKQEWAGVPVLIRGLQLPVRAVNAALASGQDERNLADSRLLPGETLGDSAFKDVAELLNEAAAAAAASPVWYSTLTRDRLEDPFIEIRPWPYALSLLTDAAWRRALGFAFF